MSDRPHFDISAHVIKQLGEELVTDEVTALVELVKNAYDADATWVNIVIDTQETLHEKALYFGNSEATYISQEDKHSLPGSIIIEDNGFGMGRQEIERGWLTFSFSLKRKTVENQKRSPKGRLPLGEKGLGRISTQRLGRRLEIFTHRDKNLALSDLYTVDQVSESEKEKEKDYESKREHHVAIDWDAFVEGTNLTSVGLYLDSKVVEKPRRGTKLVISGLLNPQVWLQDRKSGDIVSKLSQMIFPFGGKPPCRVFLTINGIREDLTTLIESIRDVAVSRFNFSYNLRKGLVIEGVIKLSRLGAEHRKYTNDDNGKSFFEYLTDPSKKFSLDNLEFEGNKGILCKFIRTIEIDSLSNLIMIEDKIADPGSFHGEIDEFFLSGVDEDEISDVFNARADYTNTVKELAGIRIYRDGFGIKPYGMDSNDWLKLGQSQTGGRSFYGIRPGNVVGYISISVDQNRYLREKTDREGFIDNPQSQNFFKIMHFVRDQINQIILNIRRNFNDYKHEKSRRDNSFSSGSISDEARDISKSALDFDKPLEALSRKLNNTYQEVSTTRNRIVETPLFSTKQERSIAPLLDDVSNQLNEAHNLVNELRNLLSRASKLDPMVDSIESRITKLQQQVTDFSELAGLGLTAEALSHEIYNIADSLGKRTKLIIKYLKQNQLFEGEIVAYIEYVQSSISALRKQLSHLAPSLRYVREKKDILSVNRFMVTIKDFYQSRFSNSGINIEILKVGEDLKIRINRGKLTQIFDNLLLNSEYWLQESIRRRNLSNPTITIEIRGPKIIVFDNGLGVDPSIESTLFQPFMSMKPKDIGRGLGLFIVQELLDSSGCEIFLLSERNQFNRRYKFQIDLSGIIHE